MNFSRSRLRVPVSIVLQPNMASPKSPGLAAPTKSSEWQFRLGFTVVTALAFITRFWGIGHPDQVVFDEVHFGKVRAPAESAHGETL